jgi:hypothetical protein
VDPETASPAGNPLAPVVGGARDSRPKEEWKPEDGFAPTAVLANGATLNRRQCCARSKRHGLRCTQGAVPGKSVCRMHGGAPCSGRPPTHGRYSAALGSVGDLYRRQLEVEGADDPTDEIALMRTALETRTSRAIGGDSAQFRVDAVKAYTAAAELLNGAPTAQFLAAFAALGDMLGAGVAADVALRDVFDMANETASRATHLRRVRVAEAHAYTDAHLVVLFKVFMETVREVTDVQIAARVATTLRHRLPAGSCGAVDSGGSITG